MTLVDTNVILDVTTRDPVWYDWSLRQLDMAATLGPLLINDTIYAELSVGYERIEEVDELLAGTGLVMNATPRAALFLAGKAFRHYRTRGGTRSAILPDFFIGAHAAVRGLALLTRDISRYRSYFPAVRLLAPPAA